MNFIANRSYYVEELEKINSTNIHEIKNFFAVKLSIYISNCLDYKEGKNYGNKCYTSVDVRSYYTDYNFEGFYVGREYVSGGIEDFLNRLYELSEKFQEAFVFTSSAKKFCKKILLKNMNSEEWKNYDPKIKEFLSLNKNSDNSDYILTKNQFEKLNSLIDKYLRENI